MSTDQLPPSVQQVTWIWLLLMLATVLAALLSFLPVNSLLMAFLSTLILVWKGQLIVDHFMGLKTASIFWRLIMSAYCVVIAAVVFGMYYLTQL